MLFQAGVPAPGRDSLILLPLLRRRVMEGVKVEVTCSFFSLPGGEGEAAAGAAGAQEGAAAPAGGGRLEAEREVAQAGHSGQSHQGPDRGDDQKRPAAEGECGHRFGGTIERPHGVAGERDGGCSFFTYCRRRTRCPESKSCLQVLRAACFAVAVSNTQMGGEETPPPSP